MSFGSNSWLSVAADSSGTIYAPAFNQQQDAVDGYAAGTTGASVPTIDGQGFSQPLGIFIDASGYFYVANFGNSSVDVFDTKTALEVGAPAATATITGSGLSEPYGVYVR
jgi:DNA-binding beta-propeller fold protein YncE